MVPVARRNRMADKTSFLVAVGGVAFAVFLIIIIVGIYLEFRRTFTALIDDDNHMGGDESDHTPDGDDDHTSENGSDAMHSHHEGMMGGRMGGMHSGGRH